MVVLFLCAQIAPTVAVRATSMSARYADLKSSKISILSNPHSHKVSLFHKNLKHSTGAKLGQLQVTQRGFRLGISFGIGYFFLQFFSYTFFFGIFFKTTDGLCLCKYWLLKILKGANRRDISNLEILNFSAPSP